MAETYWFIKRMVTQKDSTIIEEVEGKIVPDGKTLADLEYTPEEIATAVQVTTLDIPYSKATMQPDNAILQARIDEELEAELDEAAKGQGRRTRIIVNLLAWTQLQDYRTNRVVIQALAGGANGAKAKRIPAIMALAQERYGGISNAFLDQAADLIESALWDNVSRIWRFEARSTVAKINTRNETNAVAKLTLRRNFSIGN